MCSSTRNEITQTCLRPEGKSSCCVFTRIDILTEENQLVVKPKVSLDIININYFCSSFYDHLYLLLLNRKTIIFDLSTIRYIDSTGISLLLKVYLSTQSLGVSFYIVNTSVLVLEIFKIAKLDGLLCVK
ncbi:STAS domain-containing protein [Heliobacterium chlorum]|uniref:STAS domain-containing protein n=1 Tax=Heliobacterium chlorum TaxID=2698 RepID=A0ABR7T403_HELCL|nr:STAS domain-containing protein [Heliobacterium chlorum]